MKTKSLICIMEVKNANLNKPIKYFYFNPSSLNISIWEKIRDSFVFLFTIQVHSKGKILFSKILNLILGSHLYLHPAVIQ